MDCIWLIGLSLQLCTVLSGLAYRLRSTLDPVGQWPNEHVLEQGLAVGAEREQALASLLGQPVDEAASPVGFWGRRTYLRGLRFRFPLGRLTFAPWF